MSRDRFKSIDGELSGLTDALVKHDKRLDRLECTLELAVGGALGCHEHMFAAR
jgi:hypothetical protein